MNEPHRFDPHRLTHCRRLAASLGLLLVLGLLSAGSAASHPEAAIPTIYLKSRTFAPPAGVTLADRALLATQAAALQQADEQRLHVLVQFPRHPDVALHARLAHQGVRLLTYLPDNAWYVSVPAALGGAGILPLGARWMGAIRPTDKVSPVLQDRPETSNGPIELYVHIHPDVPAARATRAVEQLGGAVQQVYPEHNLLDVVVPDASYVPVLAASDVWYWITRGPLPKVALNDGSRAATKTNAVHALGFHGNPASAPGSIVLAIWDAGKAAPTHPAFGDRLRFGDDDLVTDDHATHVAGTMAGNGANSPGTRDLRGHADEATIVTYDWDDSVVEHLAAIRTFDIDASQNSWGFLDPEPCMHYGRYEDDTLAPAYDAIVNGVYGKRISVVFAAGNSQWACTGGWDTISPPAGGKNTITVGATNSDDKSMTDFSSWGPVDDGRLKPDVVAPGCESAGEKEIWSTLPPTHYGGACGTSMAAPAVTGILGLLLEAYNVTYGEDPWPSTLKAVLLHTAEDLGNPGPDFAFGYGHVDAAAGINAIIPTSDGSSRYIRQAAVSDGEERTFAVASDGSRPLKCTLVWDDPAGTSSSTRALINDLDLRLRDPAGASHLPWVLFPDSNPSRSATRGDNQRDNVEQVVVENPVAGPWTAVVIGDSVPLGPEEFSLICPFATTATPPAPSATPTTTPTPTPTSLIPTATARPTRTPTVAPTPSPTATALPTPTQPAAPRHRLYLPLAGLNWSP